MRKTNVRDTSREAHHLNHVTGRADDYKAAILATLATLGRAASTREIATHVGVDASSITGARGELHRAGLIVFAGKGVCEISGRTVRRYRLPDGGETAHPREVVTGTPPTSSAAPTLFNTDPTPTPEDAPTGQGGGWNSKGW